ncbi:MAG: LegC family aminotransferase [Cetobacterium sp.]
MKNILLIGAGSAGQKISLELEKNKDIKILGFLDKDKNKFGKKVNDILVLGDYQNIRSFVKNLEINEVIITSTMISSEEINFIKKQVMDLKIKVEHLPDIEELDLNKEFYKQLKEINIPLSIPNLEVQPILENLKECLESGWVSTGGRFITEFEDKIAKYVGVDQAVGIQSGTAGLHTTLKVMGVESGEEVLAPTLTFIAAVNPITYLGAKPIFIDCDDTLCIDPLKIEKFCEEECEMENGILYNKTTRARIRVLIVVHVFGNIANMEKIMKIAFKYNLKVLEDATEALGSYYVDGEYKGKFAGTIGDAGIYSFNANKIITTGGGGMIVSNNKEILDKVRFLSVQAKTDPLYFIHDEIGYNYRMLNLQAALGTNQIDHLEGFIDTKIKNYNLYKNLLKEIEGLTLLPFEKNQRSNHWFYSIVVDKEKYGLNKDELLKKLVDLNIQTRPIWGLIHQQKPYIEDIAYIMEKSIWYHDRILNIPCSSNLTEDEIKIVVKKLKELKK